MPHTLVHRDVTSSRELPCVAVSLCGVGQGWEGKEVSGCIAEQCLSLSHSLHFSVAWQSLARWLGEQHLKERLCSFKMVFRSCNVFILNDLHLGMSFSVHRAVSSWVIVYICCVACVNSGRHICLVHSYSSLDSTGLKLSSRTFAVWLAVD